MTSAPASANWRARAFPRPCPAPVMSVRLFRTTVMVLEPEMLSFIVAACRGDPGKLLPPGFGGPRALPSPIPAAAFASQAPPTAPVSRSPEGNAIAQTFYPDRVVPAIHSPAGVLQHSASRRAPGATPARPARPVVSALPRLPHGPRTDH